jgi:hypothetical protein
MAVSLFLIKFLVVLLHKTAGTSESIYGMGGLTI